MCTLNFIDLFAGAGGLSEGFIRAGYTPLAHIEKDKYACDTLKTRATFHWLKAVSNQKQQI
jgi:DNA (cytosine-5)-methyltransferase 1